MTRQESREKKLLKNTGILALGTISSKILTFLLLPIYTNLLSAEEYGTVDVLMTVASLSIPFITLQLYSAVFRFVIEAETNPTRQKVIITTGVLPALLNYLLVVVIVLGIHAFFPFPYCGLLLLYFAANIVFEYAQCIIRGFGKNGLYSSLSFLMTAIILVSNIVMLIVFQMKGETILISNILAYGAMGAITFWKLKLQDYLSFQSFSWIEFKQMLQYSAPLIPNTISWWIANTSDRLIITFVLGAAANGIYGAANKIPTIYSTLFNVFNIAWSESLSRGANHPDQHEFINKMFSRCIRLFGCANIGLICVISLIFNFLIGEEYKAAYSQVYILILAIFVNSLCTMYGGVFDAYKKSSVTGITTVIGAVVNLIVNLSLIHWLGLYAASISTLVSYLAIFIGRKYYADRIVKIKWPIAYLIKALLVLGIVTYGYFIGTPLTNFVILLFVSLWSYWENRTMLNGAIASVLSRFSK